MRRLLSKLSAIPALIPMAVGAAVLSPVIVVFLVGVGIAVSIIWLVDRRASRRDDAMQRDLSDSRPVPRAD